MMTAAPSRTSPTSLLICAMGGEGGGVLTGWIVTAAQAEGLAVQATSVPGVAQRTGATTYYLELAPRDPDGRTPIFALFPVAGEVDVVLASELLEAARAARSGYVSPDRTDIIASTHRVFLIQEKMAMGDGRLDAEALEAAARSRARRATLLDLDRIAREHGVPISPVMLGALAGSAALPISRGHYEQAVRAGGLAVERNLAAFATAFDLAAALHGGGTEAPAAPTAAVTASAPAAQASPGSDLSGFPAVARTVIALGVARLTDYQDSAYAGLYLERLRPFATLDPILLREVARQLALRMSYEDVIRVAQLKARPDRFERIRSELGLERDEPFEVQDYFKPGINELADVLPPRLARAVLALARRAPRLGGWHVGMRLKTTSISGYLRVWLLARMRWRRRRTWRYALETREIEAWLALVRRAADRDRGLAREVAELARLIKGYGDTHASGLINYRRIIAGLVEPALAGAASGAAAAVRRAREAALADPDGKALDAALASAPPVAAVTPT